MARTVLRGRDGGNVVLLPDYQEESSAEYEQKRRERERRQLERRANKLGYTLTPTGENGLVVAPETP